MKRLATILFSAHAALAMAVGHAEAAAIGKADLGAGVIPVSTSTLAPFAYVSYCADNPDDCESKGDTEVSATPEIIGLLKTVNRAVNREIVPRSDSSDDVWSADVSSGDCEDFALTKRRRLIAAGLPSSALLMAVALTRNDEAHAVLVVRTSKGDLVLDNLTGTVLPWNKTALRWLKISSSENAGLWYAVR